MTEAPSHPGQPANHLAVRDLQAWYGESHALHGITLDVARGEVVTLLGRNGAGKITIIKSIMGLVPRRRGSIVIGGQETIALPPRRIAGLGVGYVPEERGIYASLSVRENLLLPRVVAEGGYSLDTVLGMFPNLAERIASQGTKLSGGEQQMLAIARILRTGARFLLLDEPTEGLAPVIVQQIGRIIAGLRDAGFTILLVEQNFRFASRLADRHYIIEQGRVADLLTAAEARATPVRISRYLGV